MFIDTQEYPKEKRLKGIFDPEKGIYTDEEENEIQEKSFRLHTDRAGGDYCDHGYSGCFGGA